MGDQGIEPCLCKTPLIYSQVGAQLQDTQMDVPLRMHPTGKERPGCPFGIGRFSFEESGYGDSKYIKSVVLPIYTNMRKLSYTQKEERKAGIEPASPQ